MRFKILLMTLLACFISPAFAEKPEWAGKGKPSDEQKEAHKAAMKAKGEEAKDKAEMKADEMKDDAEEEMDEMKDEMKEKGEKAKGKAKDKMKGDDEEENEAESGDDSEEKPEKDMSHKKINDKGQGKATEELPWYNFWD
jgi:hypothetical protein